MVKKKICKRRSLSTTASKKEPNSQPSDPAKHELATKAVQKLYDKNPDTSVYARRYQYKKQSTEEE